METVMDKIDELNYAIEDISYQEKELLKDITRIKKELDKVESEYVGVKEKIANLKEQLRLAKSQVVKEFVTNREVDIARMKGFSLEDGEELTQEIKDKLRVKT